MSELDEQADEVLSATPFTALGYDHDAYYFLPHRKLQLECITTSGMTSGARLLALAPYEWWQHRYPQQNSNGVDWTSAGSDLMRQCERAGPFNPSKLRGRGAWYDQGSSVLHLGNRLVVDGEHCELTEHQSSYIYELAAPLELETDVEPLTASEGAELRKLMDQLCWQKPVSSALVTGWAFLAPICGALSWRPHLWITGQKGSGKSYVINEVLYPVVGASGLVLQANSTEAGIRQSVGHDARPILFDEAEAENARDRARVQSVLELARQASSESSAEIAKGSASGKAMTYRVRSMFLMGSINVSIQQGADQSRFTICQLQQPQKQGQTPEDFKKLRKRIDSILSKDFCSRLRARAYESIPTVRHNADNFAYAVAEHLGDQRSGDQLGTLLAGAYTLKNDGTVTLERARQLVAAMDWEGATDDQEQSEDQDRLLSLLASSRVRVEGDDHVVERTVAELVRGGSGGDKCEGVNADACRATLQRCGIAITKDLSAVRIANSDPFLEGALRDSPWGGSWAQILSYVEGSRKVGPTYFAGTSKRATEVPVKAMLGE